MMIAIIGVYPMKGKYLMFAAIYERINENKELVDIKNSSLETGKSYSSINQLRYGKVVFMTDQDLTVVILKDCVLI